jgi:6-phosphogluconolactonase
VVSHFVPSLGAERITLTLPIINRAREIRIMVAGREKAPTLGAVLGENRGSVRLPVQLIRPEDGRLVWFIDRDAASALGREGAPA